jgi:DNA-binding transcriptional regulator LsrR (DeoR family)
MTRSRTGLAHTAARLYYEADLSQAEIGQRLGVSTATVSRLLREAREQGIVTIAIRAPAEAGDLAEELRDALGLKRVSIARGAPSPTPLAVLADPVRRILADVAPRPGAAVAIGWGHTIWEVLGVGLAPMPGVLVVPASGGMQDLTPHFQTNELVRLAALQTGGSARFIHAPYLSLGSWHEMLRSDPDVRAGIALWDRLEVALVGIGLPYAVDLQNGGTSVTPRGRGVPGRASGDVLLHYFDVSGEPVPWRDEGRLVAISREQLLATPFVVGVAAGAVKAPGIIGAARARLISALATDQRTAEAVLALIG